MFFEVEGIRRINLQLVYDFLGTISPSSIESETAFSNANQMYHN